MTRNENYHSHDNFHEYLFSVFFFLFVTNNFFPNIFCFLYEGIYSMSNWNNQATTIFFSQSNLTEKIYLPSVSRAFYLTQPPVCIADLCSLDTARLDTIFSSITNDFGRGCCFFFLFFFSVDTYDSINFDFRNLNRTDYLNTLTVKIFNFYKIHYPIQKLTVELTK